MSADPTYVLPISGGTPDYEIRAVKSSERKTESLLVATETSLAKAKRYLRENLPSVVEYLRFHGWLEAEEITPNIQFEIINPKRVSVRAMSISDHPVNNPGCVEPTNPIYYAPTSFATLNDPRRYKVEAVGRDFYLVHSPSGGYHVDMEQNAGHGACSCDDFTFKRNPQRSTAEKRIIGGELSLPHEDCPHLKHVKFLLGRPFGAQTWIPVSKLIDPGYDPVPTASTESPVAVVL